MTLTPIERMLLVNQLLILEKLYPEEARDRAHLRKALEEGYELHYGDAFEFMGKGISKATCQQIIDIFQMHRVLHDSYGRLKPKGVTSEMIQFDGFDGNGPHEAEALSYTRYYINDLGRFQELVRPHFDFNSHATMFPRYERMLAAWRQSKDLHQLSEADIDRIVKARNGL